LVSPYVYSTFFDRSMFFLYPSLLLHPIRSGRWTV
jgi:hypothetical protein